MIGSGDVMADLRQFWKEVKMSEFFEFKAIVVTGDDFFLLTTIDAEGINSGKYEVSRKDAAISDGVRDIVNDQWEYTVTMRRELAEKLGITNPATPKVVDSASEEPILKFFAYEHLPENLQKGSRPFFYLAQEIVHNIPRNPERTIALRKLLESKDSAVRALL